MFASGEEIGRMQIHFLFVELTLPLRGEPRVSRNAKLDHEIGYGAKKGNIVVKTFKTSITSERVVQ